MTDTPYELFGIHPLDDLQQQFHRDVERVVHARLEVHTKAVDRAVLQALANGRHGIAVVETIDFATSSASVEIHEDVRVPYGTIAYVKDLDHLEHADLPEAPRETLVAALAHLASLELARR